MKQFLKYTLATVVGILIASFISMFVFFGAIGAMMSSGEAVTKVKPNSVYHLELAGILEDRSEDNPIKMPSLSSLLTDPGTPVGLDDILSNIRKAKTDPNIAGIRIDCDWLGTSYASLKEIRDALIDFKASGKFIVTYADQYPQALYYLASVADKILLNPIGAVGFHGLASQTLFYKDMLDKLGVEMQIVKVGTFKSAVEPSILMEMSDANRQQVEVYVNSTWNNILEEISAARHISIDQLNRYADMPLDFCKPEEALEYGFVDSLVYETGVNDVIEAIMEAEPKMVSHADMTTVLPVNEQYHKDKVGIIYAVGNIDMGKDSGIVSEDLTETIREVADDDNVKAVVLRINSGGGSAYGSEQIWHALTQLKAEKPLIVSMGDMAASGGYYIACMADRIVAQPTTLTGSIGVFGQIPNAEGLTKKIGLNIDGVKTNKHSEGITLLRPMSPEQRDLLQMSVNRTYELFVKRCADGRGMTPDAIKAIAEGRVWTGTDALEIGLVDQLGGLADAVALAAEAAGLESYGVAEFPEKEDFMTRLMKEMSVSVEARVLRSALGTQYRYFKTLETLPQQCGVMALMPFEVEVK